MELSQIPGLAAALAAAQAEEAEIREASYLDIPRYICGVRIEQLTPYSLLLLFIAESPFLSGREPEPEDVASCLWVLSPGFTPVDMAARDRFIASVGDLDLDQSREEIRAFISDSLLDSPGGSAGTRAAFASWCAALCHTLASAYGWDDETTMRKPIPRLYQYLRLIRQEHSPRAPTLNRRSDRIRRELVAQYMGAHASSVPCSGILPESPHQATT